MNWYKIAKPLLEEIPANTYYMDIGHKEEEGEYLWAIGPSFIFEKKEILEDGDYHEEWLSEDFWFDGGIATGRYQDGQASIFLSRRLLESPSKRSIMNKVVKILDREFEDPIIMGF